MCLKARDMPLRGAGIYIISHTSESEYISQCASAHYIALSVSEIYRVTRTVVVMVERDSEVKTKR